MPTDPSADINLHDKRFEAAFRRYESRIAAITPDRLEPITLDIPVLCTMMMTHASAIAVHADALASLTGFEQDLPRTIDDRARAGLEARLFQGGGEPGGKDEAAVGDAEEEEAFGARVAAGDGGSNAFDRLLDRFGVVLRGCGHEPKVVGGGAGLVQRKGGR